MPGITVAEIYGQQILHLVILVHNCISADVTNME